jgi:short-subunit dehydrogenase
MKKGNVLILGGSSDIGLVTAYYFASKGYAIDLAARNSDNLEVKKKDIEIRFKVRVSIYKLDVLDYDTHDKFIESLRNLPDIVICFVGLLGGQDENGYESLSALKVMSTNFSGPANICGLFSNAFEKRGYGIIVGVSSVAGERGRQSNYVYGSSKAAFTSFFSGLRNRLSKKNVQVITILPGYVKTKMTKDLKLPPILTAKPIDVSMAIHYAIQKKQNIVYVKKIWKYIMIIVKLIPERIFKLMKL